MLAKRGKENLSYYNNYYLSPKNKQKIDLRRNNEKKKLRKSNNEYEKD